ncbi:hypothetical protein Tco_0051700 [Tanacetum coccineum]
MFCFWLFLMSITEGSIQSRDAKFLVELLLRVDVAISSAEDTNSINEVNTTNGVSTAAGHSSQGQASSSSSYTNESNVLNSLLFSQVVYQLDDEDLEQIDHDDLEEMDIKWQVLIKLRLNALTVIKEAILPGNVEHQEIKGTGMEMQGIGVGKGQTPEGHSQDEPTEFALMAYTSGSDTETVQNRSKWVDQTLKNVLDKMMDQEEGCIEQSDAVLERRV